MLLLLLRDFEAYCLVWWHVVARFSCKLSIYDIVKVTLRHLYLRAEWKVYMNVFMLIQVMFRAIHYFIPSLVALGRGIKFTHEDRVSVL